MDLQVPGVPARKWRPGCGRASVNVGVGYYPKQEFVHVDVRDEDVRWVDTSTHGEERPCALLCRGAGDELPSDAPRLAWDEEQDTLRLAGVAGWRC